MNWRNEDEQVKRLKWKLQLYGSYKREYEMLEHKYFEIQEELSMNDMPKNAAKNLGFHGDGPYHPAVEKMKIEEASLIDEMSHLDDEISYLGLDTFMDSLSPVERTVIDEKYIRNNTFRNIAVLVNSNKSTVHRMINKISEKRDPSLIK